MSKKNYVLEENVVYLFTFIYNFKIVLIVTSAESSSKWIKLLNAWKLTYENTPQKQKQYSNFNIELIKLLFISS